MANRIKQRVKTQMKPRGFKATDANRGPRKGEQGKPRHPGYSGGKRKHSVGVKNQKRAYAKRIAAG